MSKSCSFPSFNVRISPGRPLQVPAFAVTDDNGKPYVAEIDGKNKGFFFLDPEAAGMHLLLHAPYPISISTCCTKHTWKDRTF